MVTRVWEKGWQKEIAFGEGFTLPRLVKEPKSWEERGWAWGRGYSALTENKEQTQQPKAM